MNLAQQNNISSYFLNLFCQLLYHNIYTRFYVESFLGHNDARSDAKMKMKFPRNHDVYMI